MMCCREFEWKYVQSVSGLGTMLICKHERICWEGGDELSILTENLAFDVLVMDGCRPLRCWLEMRWDDFWICSAVNENSANL